MSHLYVILSYGLPFFSTVQLTRASTLQPKCLHGFPPITSFFLLSECGLPSPASKVLAFDFLFFPFKSFVFIPSFTSYYHAENNLVVRVGRTQSQFLHYPTC